MSAAMLDSRLGLGTDQHRLAPLPSPYAETTTYVEGYVALRTVRVVLGRLGGIFRLSAPELEVVAEGETISDAWDSFRSVVSARDDAAWLTFDVGRTRPGEIADGLDAPEDEDWAEPSGTVGAD
ncbi:MAG: hypothetical protein JSU86_20910 [Phycisphaerales bacterium]|nr:MAG: hypothetical protein JSU86_20910 [Phycisphaerales bacterium]